MGELSKPDLINNRAAHISANDGIEWLTAVKQATEEYAEQSPTPSTGKPATMPGYSVSLRSYDDIADDVPTWAWEHGDKGRIPLGALTLFAGRPAAGKSTAARWFASQVTRGTLPGQWLGTPHSVAYIAGEESPKYSVKPSLRAAGADMKRVLYPQTVLRHDEQDETSYNFIPADGMPYLAKALREHDVKLVIVDPLMKMIGGNTDVYRNNEVRDRLQPWVDLADEIDGVVIGITHLNKSGNGDVLAGINGSSAFGELCRAAFGFANDPDSDEGYRVMSQEKNSLGVEDLALTYALIPETVTTESGKSAEMPRFTIVGESDRKVGEILRTVSAPIVRDDDDDEVKMVVLDYLESNGGSAPAGEVLKATRAAGLSDKTVKNRRKALGIGTHRDGPNRWVWSLERGPDESTLPRIHGDLGTSGPSSSEGTFEVPKQSRSREPEYTRDGRDLANVTPLSGPTDDDILVRVSDEYPMSPSTIAGSVPGLSIAAAPDRLKTLADKGMIIADNRGRYTRKDPA